MTSFVDSHLEVVTRYDSLNPRPFLEIGTLHKHVFPAKFRLNNSKKIERNYFTSQILAELKIKKKNFCLFLILSNKSHFKKLPQ